jgi:RNA-binding protein
VKLTGKQKRYLRSLGNPLNPVVRLGKDGLDEGVVGAVNEALERHELIKVKLELGGSEDRFEAANFLAEQTKSEVAQVMGGTILLYRKHPKEPKISLP